MCGGVVTRRVWQLTPPELAATLDQLLPGSGAKALALRDSWADSQGFSNEPSILQLSPPQVAELAELSADVADRFAMAPPAYAGCVATTPDQTTCVDAFIAAVSERAFRRPASAQELARYRGLYDAEALARGSRSAIRQAVRALIMSPQFLFRSELGTPTATPRQYRLTSFEVASAISYAVLGGPPDAELAAAASRDELQSDADISAQVARLVDLPNAATGLRLFLSEQLKLDDIASIDKLPDAAQGFTPALAKDMQDELAVFIRHVLWEADGSLRALLLDRSAQLTPALAALYGVPADPKGGAVQLPERERGGLLLRAGFLATFAHPDTTSPVFRGKFIRTQLLCGTIPPPPDNVDVGIAAQAPPAGQTKRDQLAAHQANPACKGCHDLMDPMGLALENYDLVGAYRDTEGGAALDSSGIIRLPDEPESSVQVSGALELSRALAELPQVRQCLADQATRYVTGVLPSVFRDCSEGQSVASRAEAAGDDIKAMFAAALTAQLALTRTAEEN
jgi:hypothetical protein